MENFESLFSAILCDDLDFMNNFIREFRSQRERDSIHSALMDFCSARILAEESWNYETAFESYKLFNEKVMNFQSTDEGNLVFWLMHAAQGHLSIHKGLASWTLANYIDASQHYKQAVSEFQIILDALNSKVNDPSYSKVRAYAEGWKGFAEGDYHNVIGFDHFRNNRIEEAIREFTQSDDFLNTAIQNFKTVNNRLGIGEAKAHRTDIEKLENLKMVYGRHVECCWMDFAQIVDHKLIEKLLSIIPGWQCQNPPELLFPEGNAKSLMRRKVRIGELKIGNRIAGQNLPVIGVDLEILPKYNLMISFSLMSEQDFDVVDLFVLKILNTNAVPEYDMVFSPLVAGFNHIHLKGRLFDLSRTLLSDITRRFLKKRMPIEINSSFALINITEFSEGEITGIELVKKYPYLKGLFTLGEVWSWNYLIQFMKSEILNLAESLSELDVVIHANDRLAIIIGPNTPEWEIKIYSDVIVHNLVLRMAIRKFRHDINLDKNRTKISLKVLKNAISNMEPIPREDVTKIITENIEVKVSAQEAIDFISDIRALMTHSIGEIYQFAERTHKALHVDEDLSLLENLIQANEKLHDLAYNISQEYLSWLMTVNSDYTNKLLIFFNIISVTALGLSLATAVLKTPIEFTLAFLTLAITFSIGMTYVFLSQAWYFKKKKRH
jgi:tetratricopeptide (TPR) repeat protein